MIDRQTNRFGFTTAATLALLVAGALPARAALGEKLVSIERDRRAFGGTLHRRDAVGHVVHEIETPEGGLVRELVSPSGTVFGVAWEGPRVPDLRQLLGESFTAYSEAAKAPRHRRGPLTLEVPGLVFESYGHARAFRGRAFIKELLPAGVSVDAIH